jgi:hypothetical protein
MNHDRWEYKVVALGLGWRMLRHTWTEHAAEALNREGAQGWELVSSQWMGTQLTLFFKRPR